MILPLREIDVMGVFIAPFVLCLALAAVATVIAVKSLCRRARYATWHYRPLIELGLFTGVLASLVLLLGRV